jgi:hypothetical protein
MKAPGGYLVFEADDLDAAVELASAHPDERATVDHRNSRQRHVSVPVATTGIRRLPGTWIQSGAAMTGRTSRSVVRSASLPRRQPGESLWSNFGGGLVNSREHSQDVVAVEFEFGRSDATDASKLPQCRRSLDGDRRERAVMEDDEGRDFVHAAAFQAP